MIASDDDRMKTALVRAKLPVDDLELDGAQYFTLASDEYPLVFCGLVHYGQTGFLRSLVVAEKARGRSKGSTMLTAVLHYARTTGIRDVWLLTTDAESFFLRHGFEAVARGHAPPEIAATRQYSALCPDTARLMRHRHAPL
jgi:amino-acid N-acetyltransferase